ncbi:TonB-dependent receptor [Elizabethkingia anophelis]|uniref:TonB-dependent receptor plug domain-containing protein n=1 Tax=Elizabethkingia anophelis TaxID=1117645 RepID=UPI000995D278|nr:TonB-dependent receptor plug domain-containing protein [Elizabethkingia anophelis]AQW95509.1 hypothetical protein BBD30_15660 [Elizabethkingia anophelis]OPB62616.1 hypothetical protein BAS07_15350 [Elizabethkingia anophelis]
MRIKVKILVTCSFFGQLICFGQEKSDTLLKFKKIEEVTIISKDPISEKFSVKKINRIDIYLNPASNADPLKAVSVLPASTDVEESANPSLRGGGEDRSRVYLNGSPIINPIRFGRDNGLGNFSLFNTEIIDKMYVYASNPPLTLGNSSAGIVEIETNNKLRDNGFQISTALSNIGAMLNKKISEDNFIQMYGNFQFDNFFLKLNKNIDNLNSFSTLDFGLNTHMKVSNRLSFNSFNYFIDEKYDIISNTLNFISDASGIKSRFFFVNNLDYSTNKVRIRYATMFDYTDSKLSYGIMNSNVKSYRYFNAIGIKKKYSDNFVVQYGIESSIYSNLYNEKIPTYYYALSPKSPTVENNAEIDFYYVEPYLFLNYEISKGFGVSGAIRKNILKDKGAKSFVSYQMSSHYEINDKNRLIISGGRYHSYSTPNYYVRDYTLLSSNQLALDYYFNSKTFGLSYAVYYKKDTGNFTLNDYERYDQIKTLGAELGLDFIIYKNISLVVSNSYINQKQYISDTEYNTKLRMNYFIKSQIIYKNPKLFNLSLLFTTRPGNNYTSVNGSNFNTTASDYEPIFNTPFSSHFSKYSRFDLTVNKLIPMKSLFLIAFASINNVFDKKNHSSAYYNYNYTEQNFNLYQRRTLYFGLQFNF